MNRNMHKNAKIELAGYPLYSGMRAQDQDAAINQIVRSPMNWKEENFSFEPLEDEDPKLNVDENTSNDMDSMFTIGQENSGHTYIRKIVVCTNIAETSLTVKGIKFVIDCGKAKRIHYN